VSPHWINFIADGPGPCDLIKVRVMLFDDDLLKRQDDEPWRAWACPKRHERRFERSLANAALQVAVSVTPHCIAVS